VLTGVLGVMFSAQVGQRVGDRTRPRGERCRCRCR
jgi:hypothetical protein